MTEKIEKVKEALKKLGYKKGTKIKIIKRPFDCVDVWANNEYLGVFDFKRDTFTG